ncbi:MAG: chorismate mutase [Actinomycetota bacterium]
MNLQLRALRGAIQIDADTIEEITAATIELVQAMLDRNDIAVDDLVSIIFTATPDLHSAFPAAAARGLGLGHIPLLCAAEIDVEGALPRVIRVMMHATTAKSLTEISHVYLRGAVALRQDLAQ